ncbi:metallophosphoesterase [Microbacterium halophytorum]|uniref:metallophosphoesterase n=1 Tax=Microbacterium halophytorum TaxID=2067568 RepID=UPI000CFB95B6|nr:metallophosphoesterase [Microbacterium halophytorum]
MSGRRTALTVLAAAASAAAAAGVWGIGIERHLYTLRARTVHVLEPGSRPIRALHISDPHLAPWQKRRAAWISRLAALRPDLVISTGDNMGHPDALPAVRAALGPFAGTPGVFVHGSNDLWAPKPRNPLKYLAGPSRHHPTTAALDTEALDAFLRDDLGWTPLDNTAAVVSVAGRDIRFMGTNDAHHQLEDLESAHRALIDLPDASLTLGVTHAPYRHVLDAFIADGADALFAGHTHGGQVRLPGYGALVANCDLPAKQTRGLSTWSHGGRTVPLHVSAGLGHSIYAPVRFACRPEATLVTLAPRR